MLNQLWLTSVRPACRSPEKYIKNNCSPGRERGGYGAEGVAKYESPPTVVAHSGWTVVKRRKTICITFLGGWSTSWVKQARVDTSAECGQCLALVKAMAKDALTPTLTQQVKYTSMLHRDYIYMDIVYMSEMRMLGDNIPAAGYQHQK